VSLVELTVARAARELSPAAVEALATQLEGCSTAQSFRPHTVDSPAVSELRREWSASPGVRGAELACALRVASTAVTLERTAQAHALVMTGPVTGVSPTPRIEQALQRLIDDAEHELLLVSFVAYRARTIVEALSRALSRGVRVTLVLETELGDEKVDLTEARHLAPAIVQQSTVLVWPVEKRPTAPNGRHGSLHAKVAVADRSRALISSANLTGFAMDINIEAGVLLGHAVASRLVQYFDQLRDAGTLVRLDE
jgi:phosphatidylserine/phosphatidylglycerophosphate/cardiolipin synthase-like enzyme